MQTQFYIERRKDNSGNLMKKEHPVFMSVSFEGNRVMLGTGIKVDFHSWDQESRRVKESYPGSFATNMWLAVLEETAEKTWQAIQNLPEKPDPGKFRSLFQELKPRYSTGFFDVFFMFLESGSQRWNSPTFRKVRTIYKHLRQFEDQTGYKLAFNTINSGFLEQFKSFYSGKGNSSNTTHKAVNVLVWFLNWATEMGYNVNSEYRRFYKMMGPVIQSAGNHIFLQWDELIKLKEYSTDSRRMDRARDLFCFMCFTGLRFTELQRLLKEDVVAEEIVIRSERGKQRRIPLNRFAREILDSYENRYYLNNSAFPRMSIITMNKYLREIGKQLGFDRQVMVRSNEGSKLLLYEHLTAGIAVNTFVANALELNIPVEIISEFTGVRQDNRIKSIKTELSKREIQKFDDL